VTDTWICDGGRLSYTEIGAGDRLRESTVREGDRAPVPVSYEQAIEAAAARLRKVIDASGAGALVALASPHASNEDLFTLRRVCDALGISARGAAVVRGREDGRLIRAEKAANAEGARRLGFGDAAPVLARIRRGEARGALVLGHDALHESHLGGPEAFAGLDALVLLDTHQSALMKVAHVVIPVRHAAEKHGTYVNSAGRVQRSVPAVEPAFHAASEGEVLARLGAALGQAGFAGGWDAAAVSRQIGLAVPDFAGADLDSVGELGRPLASAKGA
jgi:NADH-quinone oxidoreductase subunit G